MTSRAFAEVIGVNPQKIYDVLREKTQKCSVPLADSIVGKFPNVNKLWLMSGEGPMYSDSPDQKGSGLFIPSELVQMFSDMAATIRSQQEELRELHSAQVEEKKKSAVGL